MRWYGADEEVVDLGFDYLVPIMCGSIIPCIYLLLCGTLQAEGRTFLFGAVQVGAMILNAAVFCPLFLLGVKTGIRGASLSIVCSQLIPAAGLLWAFFKGKFTTTPTFGMFLKKPIPETWSAVKTGFSALVSAISSSFPALLFVKFMGNACETPEIFNTMLAMHNAYNRIYQVAIAVFLALMSGLLPAASYAYAAGRYKRVIHLLIHGTWTITVVALLFEVFVFTIPDVISSAFSADPLFKERFRECLVAFWAALFACSWQYAVTALLQACKWQISAFVTAVVTQLLMWPACSIFFYLTNKESETRLFFACMGNDVLSAVAATPFLVVCLRHLVKLINSERTTAAETTVDEVGESLTGGAVHDDFNDAGKREDQKCDP
jgi:Na+-driven multidrug efflux pump